MQQQHTTRLHDDDLWRRWRCAARNVDWQYNIIVSVRPGIDESPIATLLLQPAVTGIINDETINHHLSPRSLCCRRFPWGRTPFPSPVIMIHAKPRIVTAAEPVNQPRSQCFSDGAVPKRQRLLSLLSTWQHRHSMASSCLAWWSPFPLPSFCPRWVCIIILLCEQWYIFWVNTHQFAQFIHSTQ